MIPAKELCTYLTSVRTRACRSATTPLLLVLSYDMTLADLSLSYAEQASAYRADCDAIRRALQCIEDTVPTVTSAGVRPVATGTVFVMGSWWSSRGGGGGGPAQHLRGAT